MAEARRRERWDHTTELIAAIYNARPGIESRNLIDARDIHPMRVDEPRVLTQGESRVALDALFGT